MKKYFTAVLFSILLSLLLTACSPFSFISHITGELHKYEDPRYRLHYSKMWEKLLAALDSQDRDAFMALFCDDTAALPDFEEKVDEFLSFYQGTSSESVCTGGVEEGLTTYYTAKNYEVETDQSSYSISFCYQPRDPEFKEQPGNEGQLSSRVGLHSIVILTSELEGKAAYTQWPQEDGIFIYYTLEDCQTG